MVSLEAARAIVAECVRPLPVEEIPLSDATGRTIAEPVFNDADAPRFDRSAMDGYALRAADVPTGGASLRLIGQIGAGADFDGQVQPGTCVQINTGAPLPDGADSVVRVEDTQAVEDGAVVKINTAPQAGRHIVRRGAYGRAGDEVIPAGTCLRAEQIAIAATVGAARLRAYRRPRFAVLATGDELVAADVVPTGARIRDSNGPMLLSLLAEDGVECAGLGRVGDDRARLTAAIERGLAGDGLCLSGGISMGAFDYVPRGARSVRGADSLPQDGDQAGQTHPLWHDRAGWLRFRPAGQSHFRADRVSFAGAPGAGADAWTGFVAVAFSRRGVAGFVSGDQRPASVLARNIGDRSRRTFDRDPATLAWFRRRAWDGDFPGLHHATGWCGGGCRGRVSGGVDHAR
jgi:hypothetical protein